jgi:hypothetical protein
MNSGIRHSLGQSNEVFGILGPAARLNQRGYLSGQGIQIADDANAEPGYYT